MTGVKQQLEIERKAKVFSLFSDPNRLKILQFLSRSPAATVSELAQHIEMSIACTSHHLQLLKDNQVLISQRKGNSMYYQIVTDPLIQQLQAIIVN
jgi:DNA-binding transcriptional ArsR family regulator